MSIDKTGGPAFPIVEILDANWKIQHGTKGMTLRDYFIAHAPAEPWSFFQPEMRHPRPGPKWMSENRLMTYTTQFAARQACGEDGFINDNDEAIDAWDEEQRRQKRIQWPVYWADTMIAERAN